MVVACDAGVGVGVGVGVDVDVGVGVGGVSDARIFVLISGLISVFISVGFAGHPTIGTIGVGVGVSDDAAVAGCVVESSCKGEAEEATASPLLLFLVCAELVIAAAAGLVVGGFLFRDAVAVSSLVVVSMLAPSWGAV